MPTQLGPDPLTLPLDTFWLIYNAEHARGKRSGASEAKEHLRVEIQELIDRIDDGTIRNPAQFKTRLVERLTAIIADRDNDESVLTAVTAAQRIAMLAAGLVT